MLKGTGAWAVGLILTVTACGSAKNEVASGGSGSVQSAQSPTTLASAEVATSTAPPTTQPTHWPQAVPATGKGVPYDSLPIVVTPLQPDAKTTPSIEQLFGLISETALLQPYYRDADQIEKARVEYGQVVDSSHSDNVQTYRGFVIVGGDSSCPDFGSEGGMFEHCSSWVIIDADNSTITHLGELGK